jgi:VanZ family protein
VAQMERARSAGFVRYWLPVLAYVALIFFVSAQPRLRPPGPFHNMDKLAHVGEYGVLGYLLVRALRTLPRLEAPLAGGLLAVAIGLAIGVSDELFQSTVPGRESSALDALADGAGLLLAQLSHLIVRRT